MVKFIVPGEPKGKARPRVTRKGITYTPQDTVNYETWVKECYVIARLENNYELLKSDLSVSLVVYYPLLKSMSKKVCVQALDGTIRPSKKPDCDNIAKIILDALNGVAYIDDKQVVNLTIAKWYAEEPRVEVIIEEVS